MSNVGICLLDRDILQPAGAGDGEGKGLAAVSQMHR